VAAALAAACAAAVPGCAVGGRAAPVAAVTAFCAGQASPALSSEMSRAVPGSLRHPVVPLGISADGRTAYVSDWTRRFSGVAALDLRTGRIRRIERFASPANDQADGAWGGRWLVWEQTYSLRSLDAFTVLAWDSATGRLTRLGRSRDAPSGQPWPSPWHAPAVHGRYAAWAQGAGPRGLTEIRLADLRTGRVSVISRGHLQAPFFDGSLLVWPESGRPGAPARLRAYDPAAGRPARLPPVLRPVRGTDQVAVVGHGIAFVGADLSRLYYSPDPARRARVVLALPPGQAFTNLGGGGALAWTTTRATYVADPATGRYAQVTPGYGFAVTGQGRSVLVVDPPAVKAIHPVLGMHVVNAAAIGGPACENL